MLSKYVNILDGNINIVLIGDRVQISTEDLNKIATALAMGPELNGVHHEYRESINKIIGEIITTLDEESYQRKFSLERILGICAAEGWVTKSINGFGTARVRPTTIDDLKAKTRNRGVVDARQRYCYFAKKYSKRALKAIGQHMGGRDHSTVIHSIQAVNNLLDVDPDYVDETNRIEQIITGEE